MPMNPSKRNKTSANKQTPAEEATEKAHYAELRRQTEEKHRKAVARNRIAEAPVVEDLRRGGIPDRVSAGDH
jgi:hypothetical protein